MSLRRLVLFGLVLVALLPTGPRPAAAQELVTDLTDHLVQITTAFHGANVVLFGTAPGGGDVIVTVRGPARDIVVRRKHRALGVWLNGRGITFARVPGFYAVFTSRPLDQLLSPAVRTVDGIGVATIPLDAVDADRGDDVTAYREALLQQMRARGLYAAEVGAVRFLGGKLFRTTVEFPSDTPVGDYIIEIMLVRDGNVIAWDRTPFAVEKAGLPAEINDFSRDHGLVFGILAVCAAAATGWLSALVFRRV